MLERVGLLPTSGMAPTARSRTVTFCQGNFAAMPGVVIPDAIRYFGARRKIFFAHFRDIRGSVPAFEETFHDEGKTDMAAAMQVTLR